MAEGTRLKSLEEQLRRHDAEFVKLTELLHKQAMDTSKKIENLEAKIDTKFDNLVVKIESMFRDMNKERIPRDEGVYTASKLPILPTADSSLKKWGETATEVTVEEALEAEKYEQNCVEGNHQDVECQVFDQISHWKAEKLSGSENPDSRVDGYETEVNGLKKWNEEGNNFLEYYETLDVEQHVNLNDENGNKEQEVMMGKKKYQVDCQNDDCDGLNTAKYIWREENNCKENNLFQFQTVVVPQMNLETISFEKFYGKPFIIVGDGIIDFGNYGSTRALVETTIKKARTTSKSWTELFTAFKGGTWSVGLYDFLDKQVTSCGSDPNCLKKLKEEGEMGLEITQFLLAAQSADAKIEAESNLNQFREQNLPSFLLSLSVELFNDRKPTESRILAGIVLKNTLDAKDASRKQLLVQQWVTIDVAFKSQIKNLLLSTLGSSVWDASHTASQVIAKIASIEIPQKEWPELIGSLLVNMTQQDRPASLKRATLETLGYVCEEISYRDMVQDEVNSVLTAVVQGMNVTEQNPAVRLAAVRALYNALDFAQTNFENKMERDYIMKVVCEAAIAQEAEIRQAAFECLVSIASTYYEVLEPYMQTIFELTSNAVKGDVEAVALQAIEFWSSICDEEIELQEYEVSDVGDSSTSHSHFIEKALPTLVPMLLETLLKQDEDQDQEDGIWNLAMAGGTCLGLVARTVGDAVVPLVMPFVEANIVKQEWRFREAATYAFGSILEGPSIERLSPMVNSGLDFLLNAMRDQSSHVKDTTAWTLSRIFELLHTPATGFTVISPSNLQQIVAVLLESIKDAPHVAERVCGAIYYLAQGYEDAGTSSYLLTPYLPDIIGCLIATADRTDGSDSKLRFSAYETLNEVVRCSNLSEASSIITQLLPVIMTKLGQTLELQIISSDDRERQGDLQASLCGVMQVIIQKLSSDDGTKPIILQVADQIMMLFLKVFDCRSSTVHEEAMLAIGALAYATGPEFGKYMPEFYKYLEKGLQNFEEYQVCAISVGVVGDISRALDDKILPYCDGIMHHLLNDLSSDELHRSVKPPIFSCFGDIALAIGEHFEKYVNYALSMMHDATKLCAEIDNSDEEMMDYGNQLKRSIFEAYSGILQGFKNSKANLLLPHAPQLLEFIERVAKDQHRDEGVTKAAVAVLGDIADALGSNIKMLYKDRAFCMEFLHECLQSDDEQLKETAVWTQGMIGRVCG